MKLKHLFMKTLFVAVGLCVGQSVWAETITFDFKTAEASGGITAGSLTKSSTVAGYIAASSTAVYYPTQISSELKNYFAFQYNNTNEWSVDKGRGGLWSYTKSGSDENFSLCNLQAGDIVTITLQSGEIYFSSLVPNATWDNSGVETTVARWESLVSNRPYKIKGDGKLDLQAKKYQSGTRDHMVISKIVIERSYTRLWGMDFITLANNLGAGTGGKSVTKSGTASFDSYYNITDEGFNSNFGVNNDNWQIRANSNSVGLWPYNLNNSTMAIRNLTKGQFVVFWASDAVTAGSNAIKVDGWSGDKYYTFQVLADGVASFTPTKSSYIYSVGVYNHNNEIVGAMDKSSGFASWVGSGIDVPKDGAVLLKFKNHGTNTQNYFNWCLGINDNNDAFKANIRADWAALDAGGVFTYQYASSTNAGTTASSVNWTDFKNDLQDADVELNLTYKDGKLFITGTTFKDDNIYYFNYTYGDGTYDKAKWIVHPFVEKAWLEIISKTSTSVRTAPVHATSISAGNVGTTGFSTFASTLYPLDLSVISGAEVYYAEAVNGSTVKFKSTDASVPAGEGLLLKGTAGTAVTINIADAGTAISGNLLKGCTTETAGVSGADKYVLVNNSGYAEFQNLSAHNATIPAGKAYLDATGAGARSLTIVFDDEDVTGVNEVRSQKEDVRSEWFDLQGRKVAQPAKGLYIVNGKKVVIK